MSRLITPHALRRTTVPSGLWLLTAPDLPEMAPMRVYVPCDARMMPGLQEHTGPLRYEKQITCAGTLRIITKTDGASRMLLDGEEIASGEGWLEALVHDLPYGEHTLVIEAERSGVIRPVEIEQMGSAYISDMKINTRRQGRLWLCTVEVTVTSLSDEAQTFDLDVEAGPAGTRWEELLLPAHGTTTLRRTIPAPMAKRWSPARPVLYKASAVLWLDGEPADDLRDRFGFCQISIENGAPVVNGERIEGEVIFREEVSDSLGRIVPPQTAVCEVLLLKQQGYAAVRTGDDEIFLDACDEIGMMVIGSRRMGNHPCVAEIRNS